MVFTRFREAYFRALRGRSSTGMESTFFRALARSLRIGRGQYWQYRGRAFRSCTNVLILSSPFHAQHQL
jgi:hypothetical protein